MRRLINLAALALLAMALHSEGVSQDKTALSVGADFLFPQGDFRDIYNAGFGGSAQFLYLVDRSMYAGLTAGFYSWSGKTDVVAHLKGVPLRGLLKFKLSKIFYIIAEAGILYSWTGEITVRTFTGSSTIPGTSSVDFNYSGGLGIHFPLNRRGSLSLDTAARYEGAARSGVASNNIALRVGILFGID